MLVVPVRLLRPIKWGSPYSGRRNSLTKQQVRDEVTSTANDNAGTLVPYVNDLQPS